MCRHLWYLQNVVPSILKWQTSEKGYNSAQREVIRFLFGDSLYKLRNNRVVIYEKEKKKIKEIVFHNDSIISI